MMSLRICFSILLALCVAVSYTGGSAAVCTVLKTRSVSQTHYITTYRLGSYTIGCGWWLFRRRCLVYQSVSSAETATKYVTQYYQDEECCTGYSGTPPNCPPVCADSCGNCASCVAPGVCTCDPGYIGNDCCTDINECLSFNGGCEDQCTNTVGSYTCRCPTGFSLISHTACQDDNECDTENGGCAQICKNTPGSYSCGCYPGYTLNSDGHACDDNNECTADTDGCNQICQNTVGSYYCDCNSGYALTSNQRTCEDINECSTHNGGCHGSCTNTAGSRTCSCGTGYALEANGYECDDKDECSLGTSGCAQNCHNTIGSFTCSCNTGYALSSNAKSCNDINECNTNKGGCEHTCTNTVGSFSCTCRTGYSLSGGLHCSDINECNTNNGGCSTSCRNTVGSYYCQCNSGYQLQSNGRTCQDINECTTNKGGCGHNCINTAGSYHCTCNTGYYLSGNGKTCNDVNECGTNNGGCDQVCSNTVGSYSCSCSSGYSLANNGRDCNDINECNTNNGGCSHNCHNTAGSYFCTCNAGYALKSNQRGCQNINECNQGNGGCEQSCTDTAGSFTCTCATGYQLTSGRHCSDINECSTNNGGCEETCINTVGSYYCECGSGSSLNSDNHNCDDINECNHNNGGCQHRCTNTVGSFKCTCNAGYHLNLDNRTCSFACDDSCHHCVSCTSPTTCNCISGWTGSNCCQDVNECAISNGGCAHKCHNTNGSYVCSCRSGYTLQTNGKTCIDNDECSNGNNSCNQLCTNIGGSYECYCNTGYELLSNGTTCVDTNECLINNGGCNQTCTNTVGSYICSCSDGYTLDTDSHSCNDKNECSAADTNDCSHHCYNTVGSYVCDCNVGYKLDDDGLNCVDDDECSISNGGCNQTCTNTVGSYNCSCLQGYELDDDGQGCSDRNECNTNHACDQHCHNSYSSYYCTCDNGYRLQTDGRTCTDINECAEHSSGCNQLCTNTIGSRTCSCYTGYQLSSNNRTCTDINECNTNNGGCGTTCTNTVGSYNCSCNDGYELDNDLHACNEINECERNTDLCEHNCTNTPGSYNCSCRVGYFLETNNHNCTDINECNTSNGGCNQTCVNEIGSFHCECDSGYTLDSDGFGCTDINECQTPRHGCDQLCSNTIGSYYCHCYDGYRLNSTSQRTCYDIDECSEDTDGCDHKCNNTIGSYYCSCNIGYSLNTTDNHSCEDINECLTNNGGCNQTCHNSIGSYSCSCGIGFELHIDKHDCNDINECNTAGDNNCEQVCINNYGSYTCDCFIGYQLDSDNYNCSDINECDINNGTCDHYCTNEIGSYHCSCQTGYYLASDGHGCNDIDECAMNYDSCEQNCHNTNGSYYCSCNTGYRLSIDEFTCDDVDECDEAISGCEHNCTNTIGSYNCSCLIGYYLDSDDHSCEDVNECETANGDCEHNCNNIIGSYYCTCRDGYDLDDDLHGCTGQSCYLNLTAPLNGSMSCTGEPNQVTDENCSFSCDYGFTFHGSSLRTCLYNHNWTGVEPYCIIKECPLLSRPPNAYIATKPCNKEYTSDCEIRCVDGYYINGRTPFYQTCTVDEDTNEVFWTRPPICEIIPSCTSSPCLHGGKCHDRNVGSFTCDCSLTHYKGQMCEVGILETPAIPILIVNQTSRFLAVTAHPETDLRVDVISSSSHLEVLTNSSLFLYNVLPRAYYKLTAYKEGVYTISYNVSGTDAVSFETPPPVRVVVVNSVDDIDGTEIEGNESTIPDILTPGCCSPNGLTYQCPYSTKTVRFTSTCQWNIDSNGNQVTGGVTFASAQGLTVPVSIAGTQLSDILTDNISNTLPLTENSCYDCNLNNDLDCSVYNFTSNDFLSLLLRRVLGASYLNYTDQLLPSWLTLSILPQVLTENSTFTFNDYSTYLRMGDRITDIENCQDLELDPDGLYSVIVYSNPITVEVVDSRHMYTPQENESLCIAIDLCSDKDSTVHITLPPSSRNILKNFSQVQELVNEGWELSFEEAVVSRNGIEFDDINTAFPRSYWNGKSYIDSIPLLPSFDVRLRMNAHRNFNDSDTLWTAINVTGDLYYQTQTRPPDKVEGVIDGTVTLTINTSFSNTTGEMILTTRDNPAMFSLTSLRGNSVLDGIALKLDYSAGPKDEFFSNVFECVNRACPFDVFLRLSQERKIDFVSFRTNQVGLLIDGFSFERGTLDHMITINSTTDDPRLTGAQLLVSSNLTGTQQLILNSFISLRESETGSAVQSGYWKNGPYIATLHNVAFSILDTVLTAPVIIDSNSGLSFKAEGINLLSSYKADISGNSKSNSTWRDMSLRINGSFKTGSVDSFVSDLESYTHNYSNSKVLEAQERVANAQSVVTRLQSLISLYNATLAEKQVNLTALNAVYNKALDTVAQSASILNQTQELFDSANASQLALFNQLRGVCVKLNCPDMCLPTVPCTSCDNELSLDDWGMIDNIQLEELLQYKQTLVTEKKWNTQRLCRIITKIRSWAVVSFGQICSYKTVFSNVTHETGRTLTESLNVSHIQATIMKTLDYIVSQVCCQRESCGTMSLNYTCAVTNAGCRIAQTAALNTLSDSQQALLNPLLQPGRATLNLSIAQLELSATEARINATQVAINQTKKILHSLKTQYQYALGDLQSVQEDQLPLLSIGRQNSSIQQLLRLNGVSFTTTVSSESTSSSIDVKIDCNIPLTDTNFTVVDGIDLTATLPLIQRDLANKILISLSVQLDPVSKRKRSIVTPSFNKQQFERNCATLNDVKEFLTQLNQSLELMLARAEESKSNINDAAATLASILSVNSIDFSRINFQYLQSEFHLAISVEDLLSQANSDPLIVNLTSAIDSLRQSILLNSLEIDNALSWQIGLASLYNEGITTVANISCYGFTDCLTVLTNVVRDLIVDAPSNVIDHNLISLLLTSKQDLQQLILFANNIKLVEVASLINGVSNVVRHIDDTQYWCSGLPVITQHPVSTVHVVNNDTLTLECAAESVQALKYGWRKDGFRLQFFSSVFTIDKMGLKDDGQYQCTARNAIGTVESYISNVYVIVPPVIILSPSNTTTFEGSDNGGWFACNASSHPTAGYQWLYSSNRSDWYPVENSASNELIVFKPTLSQEGWYKCRAFIGEYEDYSEPAYLTVRRATFSTLNFPIKFLMILLNRNPSLAATNYTDQLKVTLHRKLTNHTTIVDDAISIKSFDFLYSYSNSRVTVETGFFLHFNYSLETLISDQADLALPHKQNLIQSTASLEHELVDLYFDIGDIKYISLKQSLLVSNLQYLCPTGQGVIDGNFICIDCSNGMYSSFTGTATQCIPCDKGTYGTEIAQNRCEPCPTNYSTLHLGSTAYDDCIEMCPPNYYNSSNGFIPCFPCPPLSYTLKQGSVSCTDCDEVSINDGVIPECYIPMIPSSSSAIDLPDTTVTPPVSEEEDSNEAITIYSVVFIGVGLFVISLIAVITVVVLYRRKRKPGVFIHQSRARRMPEPGFSYVSNPLFEGRSRIESRRFSENGSVSESDIVKFNPLYHGAKEDEGKDGDSINSYSQVGQFFPEHPTLDPVYDQIEPVKFQKHQTYDDDDDNFDDIDKILSEY